MFRIALMSLLLIACGDDSSAPDAGADSGADDAGVDATTSDAGGDDGGDDAGDEDAGGDDAGGDAGDDAGGDAGEDDAGRMLEDGQCRSSDDCSGIALFCRAPGEFIGCGICMIPLMTCTDDDECTTAGEICDNRPEDCFCGGETTCRAGCSAGDCGPGQACGDSGRCEPASCDGADECPTNFDCDETCSRRTCSEDADCEDGWCVSGACHDTPGSCTPPVA